MAHRRARLNVFGRQLLVTRIEVDGWTVAKAAEAQGVSRTTARKWLARYRAEGWPGLEDRSSRPHRSPRMTPADRRRLVRARVSMPAIATMSDATRYSRSDPVARQLLATSDSLRMTKPATCGARDSTSAAATP